MSKNWTRKTIKLKPGEAVVVADLWVWEHMIKLYKSFADAATTKAEKDDWLGVVALVEDWVDRSTYSEEDADAR